MDFLQRKVFDFSPPPFGLDISDLSLKALWLSREGKHEHVSSFGSVAVPQGAIVDGEIVDEEAVIESVRKLVAESQPKRFRTRRVICSLPETKAFLRIISLPKMDRDEAKEAVKWEIEANMPLSIDQVHYDWQILPDRFSVEKGKMSVLVVAVARSAAERFHSVLERAGLEPVGLETESIAQVRSLLSEKEGDETALIIDIGDRRTSFVIAIGNVPVFTSSVPLSSQMMTSALAKEMGVSLDDAEEIKIRTGLGSLSLPSPQLHAIRPILENLATEVDRSLEFYLSTLRYSEKIDAVILCGGGANLQGILPYFSRRLQRDVELGNPWVNIRIGKSVPPIDRAVSVQYSTVIGLALRGLDEYEGMA
jgi:type IV pilus assembly protein PilM